MGREAVGRDGGGGERDEECWSFVLFLDRVASSAHPPTRYALKALQSGLDVEERKWAGRAETESSECSEGLLSRRLGLTQFI